jgi:hypothetical protein
VFAAYIRMEVESLDAATACEFFGVTHVCFVLFLIMQI